MTVFSGDIRFMRIFVGVPWKRGVKRQWIIENVDFQGLRMYVFGTLENEANVII